MKKIVKHHHQTFANTCQDIEEAKEYWSARELGAILSYSKWQQSADIIANHFTQAGQMVALKSEAQRNSHKQIHFAQNSRNSVPDHYEDILAVVSIHSKAQTILPAWAKWSIGAAPHQKNCQSFKKA